MNEYLLFAGIYHYPMRGWLDFQGRYTTLKEAQEALGEHVDCWGKHEPVEWAHIVYCDEIVSHCNEDRIWKAGRRED